MPSLGSIPRAGSLPILLLIFNRPDPTSRVLEAIRGYRPARLYIAADGPRESRPDEQVSTETTRNLVLAGVDWPCDVKTLFRSENLGVKKAVGGAIDWFFENEEEGVILEDDCLPDKSFFPYCETLLDRYRENDQVMHIGGDCYLVNRPEQQSYFFSKYPHIWGWATWRDSWRMFATTNDNFQADFQSFEEIFSTPEEADHWRRLYQDYFNGKYDSWAYGWTFTVWREHGLAVYPTANLVKNIGFADDAVHTKRWRDYRGLRNAPLESIGELNHPQIIEMDRELDSQNFDVFFRKPGFFKLAWKVALTVLSTFVESLKGMKPDRQKTP